MSSERNALTMSWILLGSVVTNDGCLRSLSPKLCFLNPQEEMQATERK